MQTTVYLSTNIQFEQMQSKSVVKQGLFECEGSIFRERTTNLNIKSITHALKLKNHTEDKLKKHENYQ